MPTLPRILRHELFTNKRCMKQPQNEHLLFESISTRCFSYKPIILVLSVLLPHEAVVTIKTTSKATQTGSINNVQFRTVMSSSAVVTSHALMHHFVSLQPDNERIRCTNSLLSFLYRLSGEL